MRLFHYTTTTNAILIGLKADCGRGGNGLQPQLEHAGPTQTMGVPVVWLTTQQSNIATPEHIAHLSRFPGNEDLKVGEPMFGGPVQCVVNVERSRHVMRWTEFMRTTKATMHDGRTGAMYSTTMICRRVLILDGGLVSRPFHSAAS